jgi:hypothetical protein
MRLLVRAQQWEAHSQRPTAMSGPQYAGCVLSPR